MGKPKLVLFLGSGFSKAFGYPTTNEIRDRWLEEPYVRVAGRPVETENEHSIDSKVTSILTKFWEQVFGYRSQNGIPPLLEDHFTVLDLAANSEHYIGVFYTSAQLRAIHRMSIHRTFSIINTGVMPNETFYSLFSQLEQHFKVSVITSNWDNLVELLMYRSNPNRYVDYGIEIYKLQEEITFHKKRSLPLLKLHGSGNWLYCNSCKRIFAGQNLNENSTKTAYVRKALLSAEDFELLGHALTIDEDQRIKQHLTGKTCRYCSNQLGTRVATFSYRKDLEIAQFHEIWQKAFKALSNADKWLFIGYSLPEADYELKYMLKSAQLARQNPSVWRCEVVAGTDQNTHNKYLGFFGRQNTTIHNGYLNDWVDTRLTSFCDEAKS